MDALARRKQPVKVLLELRPALDKHAGIPQQTRLLFRGLSLLDGITVEGLIQSSTHALRKGLPVHGTWKQPLTKHRQIDRLSRVVIMLEERFLRSRIGFILALVRRLIGASENLSLFDPSHFQDFIWRRLFARSLPPSDFNTVTAARFRVAETPWSAMHICGAITKFLGLAVFPRLDTRELSVMIAETPYPGTVSSGTQLVVRYHDAIPLLMPHTISERRNHQAFHYRALRQNVRSGAWFVCVSEATRKDLLSVFPEVKSRSLTIHNVASHDYFDEVSSPSRVGEIVSMRLNAKAYRPPSGSARSFVSAGAIPANPEYLLMVSTIEPRKNHLSLLAAWERLRSESPRLRLMLVGHLGWHHAGIIAKIRPWLERGEAYCLADVPSPELRLLYKHARATICPSFAEGFDLSGVEAMASGGAVVASDLPVHREVFADAARYFNPYSVDEMVATIGAVINADGVSNRCQLVMRGAEVAQRYKCEIVLPKWERFLTSLVGSEARARLDAPIMTDADDGRERGSFEVDAGRSEV
ncbi:MAG: glycosyltransferase family 4 protein [Steroidobacteraceae bacterium]